MYSIKSNFRAKMFIDKNFNILPTKLRYYVARNKINPVVSLILFEM